MWSRLSYKYRFFLIIGFVGLVLVVGYQFSIKRTLDLYAKNKDIIALTNVDESSLLNELRIKTQLKKKVDSILTVRKSSSSKVETIQRVFDLADQSGLQVIELSQEPEIRQNAYKIRLKGGYTEIIACLKDLETKLVVVKINSLTFFSEKLRRSNKENLFIDVLFEVIDYEG